MLGASPASSATGASTDLGSLELGEYPGRTPPRGIRAQPYPSRLVTQSETERTGLRRLYVALTRAVSGLIVTHAAPLPAELAD